METRVCFIYVLVCLPGLLFSDIGDWAILHPVEIQLLEFEVRNGLIYYLFSNLLELDDSGTEAPLTDKMEVTSRQNLFESFEVTGNDDNEFIVVERPNLIIDT